MKNKKNKTKQKHKKKKSQILIQNYINTSLLFFSTNSLTFIQVFNNQKY